MPRSGAKVRFLHSPLGRYGPWGQAALKAVARFGVGVRFLYLPLAPMVDRAGNRFAHSWTEELVVERIREWAALFGAPPSANEWNPTKSRHLMRSARRKALRWFHAIGEYERGDWPSEHTVKRIFGDWNSAIAAAGYPPRPRRGSEAFKIRHRYGAHVDALTDIRFGIDQIEAASKARNAEDVRQGIEDLASISLAWLEHFDRGMPPRADCVRPVP